MRVDELVVGPGREEHIARHHVRVEEAKEVAFGDAFVTRARQRRYRFIGRTETGRYLTVILVFRGEGVYSLVTAREADQYERRLYREHRGRR